MSGHGIPRISGSREKDTAKEGKKIAAYRELVKEVQNRRRAQDYRMDTLDLTSRLLSKNPEYYTIWNFRRRVLRHLISEQTQPTINLISSDLHFLIPLLMQFPKCYWIWNYRLWLLQQMDATLSQSNTVRLWNEELALVSKMLLRDERNFHGWDYRRHIVTQLEKLQDAQSPSLTESEFAYSTKMIQKALHNFSALHYRSKIIPRLLAERNASPKERRRFLETELDLMQDALIDPFNQSAWFYHQFLMQSLTTDCPSDAAIVLDMTKEEQAKYFDQEVGRISDMLEDYDDCKWIYQALLQYHLGSSQSHSSGSPNISQWLQELQRLDPMRADRWQDFADRPLV